MQNLNLSANVKQYFVHALKGIGLREISLQQGTNKEMSEAKIARLLDQPQATVDDIFGRVKLAVAHQLQNDAQSDKFIQNNTAFDRQILKSILTKTKVGNFKFADKVCDVYLRNLTAAGVSNDGKINTMDNSSLDCTAEVVLMSVIAGLKDQNLSDNEKEEAGQLWNEVLYTGYKKWLINDQKTYKPDVPYEKQEPKFEEYHRQKLSKELFKQTVARCGNDKLARTILNTKLVNPELIRQLSISDELLKQSREFCKKRGEACGKNNDPEKDLTVEDVLVMLSDEGQKAQVVTFFQSRSQEQSADLKANPKTSEVTRQNKIGNVIGNAGRKDVKKQTGSGAAVDFDKGSGLGKGKKGPWRGYKPLYDAILSFLKDLYGNVMTIGFVTKIMEKDGFYISPEDNENNKEIRLPKDLTQSWKTDYKPMPDEYIKESLPGQKPVLNLAGEFYNKTKARLLADKMRLYSRKAELQDEFQADQKLSEQVTYLEQRIATAENILKTQIPNPNSPAFKDPRYFEMLESQIMAEDANQQNSGVQAFLGNTKNNSANDEMVAALQLFGITANNATTPNRQAAKRKMAKELFQLHGFCEGYEEEAEDANQKDGAPKKVRKTVNEVLDEMTERFVKSGEIGKMVNDTFGLQALSPDGQQKSMANARSRGQHQPFDNNDYRMPVMDAEAAINQFVVNDLQQNVAKEDYNKYQVNQARSEIMDAVIAERGM